MTFAMLRKACSTHTVSKHLHRLLSSSNTSSSLHQLPQRLLSSTTTQSPKSSASSALLLVFPALTFGLGTWQVRRLQWKRNLLDQLEERTSQPAVPLTDPRELLDADILSEMEYRRVQVTGTFDHEHEIHIGPRTKIESASKGGGGGGGGLIQKGPPNSGFQIVTPFQLSTGERILINRGWVARDKKDVVTRSQGNPAGEVTLVGYVRKGEQRPKFAMKQEQTHTWQYADLDEFASILKTERIILQADADSTVQGGPVGGQTRVRLYNEHMQYIITWYGLTAALLLLILQMRRNPAAIVSTSNRMSGSKGNLE